MIGTRTLRSITKDGADCTWRKGPSEVGT